MQKILQIFASELGFKSGIMRGFQKGIILGGRTSANFYLMGLQNRVAKKFCKIFASECGSKSGIMRGFQKGITLGGRTPGSARKVFGRWVVACWILESISLLS